MIEKLKQENAELKRMLLVAIDHIAALIRCTGDEGCYYCEGNCAGGNEVCVARWVHASEAEKLLNGGESDA